MSATQGKRRQAARRRRMRQVAPHEFIEPAPYFRSKAVFDRILAAGLVLPALVLMAPVWLLVRLTSRGPVLFRQTRVGLGGAEFVMYKIRTMVQNAESRTGPIWATSNDPRFTIVGRLLRKLHLDELPQLFNVLKGDMSLVGPRPERPQFVVELAREIPGYRRRLAVRPGITGLAQINLPPDETTDCVRRKLVLDLEYIHRATLFWDVRMIAYSGMRMLGIPCLWAMRVMRLYAPVTEEQVAELRRRKSQPAAIPVLAGDDGASALSDSSLSDSSLGDVSEEDATPSGPRPR